MEQNPSVARIICDKAVLAQRARDAARKARDLTRRKTALEGTSLPGKLADCSDKDPKNCEIYIVEGDSDFCQNLSKLNVIIGIIHLFISVNLIKRRLSQINMTLSSQRLILFLIR